VGEGTYRFLKWTAICMAVVWAGWMLYDSLVAERAPGDYEYLAANNMFEDGEYERALESYDAALQANPDHLHALRGKARTLVQLGRYDEALALFDVAIAREPEFAGTYANRGICYDRMGRYEKALADYTHALQLDTEIAEGPHWLVRLLRNEPEKPPTIADRAGYLRQQLALPESQRVLRVPEEDQKQRPYKM